MAAVRERAGVRRGGAGARAQGADPRGTEGGGAGAAQGRAGGAAGTGAERAGGAWDSNREETVSEAREARGPERRFVPHLGQGPPHARGRDLGA